MRILRWICCCGRKPEVTLLECLVAWDLKVEWEHLFQTRWENNLRGLWTTPKGKQRNKLSCPKIYLPCCVSHRKYSLTLDNFSLSSQQLVPNYFLYPSIGSGIYLQEILSWFSPNKHSSATCRHLAIVETRLKSWKRLTAENYSRSIVMLLTWHQLHFSWSYWLPRFFCYLTHAMLF